jgi:dolichol-phosphate mannosyltransferase
MYYINLPVYNEELALEPLVARIDRGLKRTSTPYRVIAYNDGSTDRSVEVLERLAERYPITIVDGGANRGLGWAMRRLLETTLDLAKDGDAEEDIAFVLDADDTHNPEHMLQMAQRIQNGFDVVIASRFLRDSRTVGVPFHRMFLSRMASRLLRVVFPIKGVKDYTCGYRAYRMDVLKLAEATYGDRLFEETGFACMVELLLKLRKLTILVVEIPLVLRYDLKPGESKIKIFRTIFHTLRLMARLKFLKVSSYAGDAG